MNTYLVSYGLLLILIIASYYTSLLILPKDEYFNKNLYTVDTSYRRVLIANQMVNITFYKDKYDEHFNSYEPIVNYENSTLKSSPITLVITSSDSGKYFFFKKFDAKKARLMMKENTVYLSINKGNTGSVNELYIIQYLNKKIELTPVVIK